MKTKYQFNKNSIIAGLVVLIIGGVVLWLQKVFPENSTLCISVGCSLIASSIVSLINNFLVERVKEDPLAPWGFSRIYTDRSEMNRDCDVSMHRSSVSRIDAVGFGFRSYRERQSGFTEELLKKGVQFRILTMDPDSPFVAEREKEENVQPGQIGKTIRDLIEWADRMNGKGYEGKVFVKGYSSMTQDFYWRVDNDVFFGPYWYGIDSQRTVSYKYSGGEGFKLYSENFEKMWTDENLTRRLAGFPQPSETK